MKMLPIQKQALKIHEIVKILRPPVITEDTEMMQEGLERDSEYIIRILSMAQGTRIYGEQMAFAILIATTARSMATDYIFEPTTEGVKDELLEEFSRELEAFRILFLEWISTFNKSIYYVDKWGILNPPGVGPDDIGPVFNHFDYSESPF